jgi:hypothetical protein
MKIAIIFQANGMDQASCKRLFISVFVLNKGDLPLNYSDIFPLYGTEKQDVKTVGP